MSPLVLFGLLVCVPIAVALLLRVNAAVLFMSLCVGAVLVQYMAGDANSFITTFANHGSQLSDSTIKLVLLLLPPVLTTIFMFHSLHGPKAFFNIFPAVGTGLLTALLVKPLLSPGFQRTIEKSSLWNQFAQAQTLVVGVSAFLCLFFLWIGRRSGHEGHKKHHKA